MNQKPLLESTIKFITPSKKKIRGIKLHDMYMDRFKLLVGLLIVSSLFLAYFIQSFAVIIFGLLILVIGIFSESFLRLIYKFDGQDAVKYYAMEIYEEPSYNDLVQLHSWNTNPFNLFSEYYYPRIGQLVEEAKTKDNPEVFVSENIPDEIRLIERQENSMFNELISMDSLESFTVDPYQRELITEANYCYKFGAYTSVSVLVRKLCENLIVEILIAKGLYNDLDSEYSFEQMVDLFLSDVIQNQNTEEMLRESLDVWIRKKGNKGAHKNEAFTQDEISTLIHHANKVIQILLVIKQETKD